MRLPAAKRRLQLLAVALDVFAERGFYSTSMNDVADAAGVTKPVLYQHFGSKRELFVELLGEIGAGLSEVIGKATVDAPSPANNSRRGLTPTSVGSTTTAARSTCCSRRAPNATPIFWPRHTRWRTPSPTSLPTTS